MTFEPQAVASLPRRPYYYAPLSGGPPDTFLGHPTPVPTTSMGVTELATAPAAKVADPASQPKVPDSLGPPPGWWTRPFAPGPQKQNLPQSWLPAPISPALWPQPLTTATAWPPTVAFDVPAGADNQWASVDYLLPRETREGLGGEHRFAEQRKFSSTLRWVDPRAVSRPPSDAC